MKSKLAEEFNFIEVSDFLTKFSTGTFQTFLCMLKEVTCSVSNRKILGDFNWINIRYNASILIQH